MRLEKMSSKSVKGYLVIAIFLTLVVLQSCGTTKYKFSNSVVVPAAEGNVKVTRDDNNNYAIELNVKRLAEPKRLSPPKNLYVVWMETDRNGRKNIGQLRSTSGWFSSTLTSELKTVSTFKPTSFFITAEDNADIQFPQGQVVLSTGPR